MNGDMEINTGLEGDVGCRAKEGEDTRRRVKERNMG